MTPKPKTPSASGISRLLAAAGFARAVETRKSRNVYENTAGFHVKTRAGTVLVNYWADSAEVQTPETIATARGSSRATRRTSARRDGRSRTGSTC
jgi:hypothetical protein